MYVYRWSKYTKWRFGRYSTSTVFPPHPQSHSQRQSNSISNLNRYFHTFFQHHLKHDIPIPILRQPPRQSEIPIPPLAIQPPSLFRHLRERAHGLQRLHFPLVGCDESEAGEGDFMEGFIEDELFCLGGERGQFENSIGDDGAADFLQNIRCVRGTETGFDAHGEFGGPGGPHRGSGTDLDVLCLHEAFFGALGGGARFHLFGDGVVDVAGAAGVAPEDAGGVHIAVVPGEIEEDLEGVAIWGDGEVVGSGEKGGGGFVGAGESEGFGVEEVEFAEDCDGQWQVLILHGGGEESVQSDGVWSTAVADELIDNFERHGHATAFKQRVAHAVCSVGCEPFDAFYVFVQALDKVLHRGLGAFSHECEKKFLGIRFKILGCDGGITLHRL